MRISDWSSDVCSSDLWEGSARRPPSCKSRCALAQAQAGGFELAAGGEDVAAARRAHGRDVARPFKNRGEALDRGIVRALERRAGPGIERDQVDLRRTDRKSVV